MNPTDIYNNLHSLVESLNMAVNMRFMAAEHASSIWKEQLKLAGIDIAKKIVTKVEEKTEEVK